MTGALRDLGPREVHVWLSAPEELSEAQLDVCRSLLDAGEEERRARYLFERHQRLFAAAHGFVRSVLSGYVALAPEDWRFSTNDHGRPDAVLPAGAPPLRCNLSHTDGLVACGLVLDRDLGLDVEGHRRPISDGLAERSFAPPELAAWRALEGDAQRERFFEHWTLKEAYMKARGIGLALGLDNFWYRIEPGRPLQIEFGPTIDDRPPEWQLHLFDPTPQHRGALAVRRGSGADLALRVFRWDGPGHSGREVTGDVGLRACGA
jgi:4'-phosphopantetheinyl transferase